MDMTNLNDIAELLIEMNRTLREISDSLAEIRKFLILGP